MKKLKKEETNASIEIMKDAVGNDTTFHFKLVSKKIPLKFCEYKISNLENSMQKSNSTGISLNGLTFIAGKNFEKGTLLRVWLEVPNYWEKKSKYVDYKHTEAPAHFQVLSRVLTSQEIDKKKSCYHIFCENLNIDPIDENVLNEFLK
jgi:hypothetical protein